MFRMNLRHYVNKSIIDYSPSVIVVGAGGNGTQMVSGLARINEAIKALGHPGIDLHLYDGDSISEANIGRQIGFSKSDIGENKAITLITRINNFYGVSWKGYPFMLTNASLPYRGRGCDIVITATDNVESRFLAQRLRGTYWMDLGNTKDTGQVVIGTKGTVAQPHKEGTTGKLPVVTDLYKLKKEAGKKEQGPSCSLEQAIQRQDLLINQMVSTAALQIIWQMLRQGYLEHHGAFVDGKRLTTRPLPINKEIWKRMGVKKVF